MIPGFYGARVDGTIKTFSRGGSDITGALVARAVGADVYENWTDVSGFLMADPRIVDDPKPISTVSYKELRELSYMGASVLQLKTRSTRLVLLIFRSISETPTNRKIRAL